MLSSDSPLTTLRAALSSGKSTVLEVARHTIEHANRNVSRNTYLRFEPAELLREAAALDQRYPNPDTRPPLFGVPISLKDCFDLAGTITTFGSRFYAETTPPAATDSAMAQSLRDSGALITGKTHLHPLAYGITGQNSDYGDCLQPRDAALLTGGSSSGATASVQEDSALVGIGTDTGGSIRVPAGFCGLVGYRASHSLAARSGWWPEVWQGAAPLAPSFDTAGFLLRDPRDVAPVAQALFRIPSGVAPARPRIGYVPDTFLADAEPDVLTAFRAWKQHLSLAGARLDELDASSWDNIFDTYAGIQAHEAAAIHRGHYDHFEPAIRDRLRWGASLTPDTLDTLHGRLQQFRTSMAGLLSQFDLLMLPSAPVSRLPAAADLTSARQHILRYTTPFSMAGLPTITLPGELIGAPFGTGVQIAAAPGADPALLDFAASVGKHIVQSTPTHA